MSLSVCPSACLPVHLSVCYVVCLSLCLFVCLSVCMPVILSFVSTLCAHSFPPAFRFTCKLVTLVCHLTSETMERNTRGVSPNKYSGEKRVSPAEGKARHLSTPAVRDPEVAAVRLDRPQSLTHTLGEVEMKAGMKSANGTFLTHSSSFGLSDQ